MRLVALLAAAFLITPAVAGAQSKLVSPSQVAPSTAPQPPSPSLREGESHLSQTGPTPKTQESENDRRGTADAPLIVEVHNPPKTEKEAAENAAEQNRKASAEWWTIYLTAALVAATLMQFGALSWQGRQLKRSVTVASDAAREARDAIVATQANATAAEEANKISRDTLITSQRPWISVDPIIVGPLSFNENGAIIKLRFKVQNSGHSPALYVWPHARPILMRIGERPDLISAQRTLLKEIRERPRHPEERGFTIFPGVIGEVPVDINIIKGDIGAIGETDGRIILLPAIVGFVDCQFTFSEERRYTGFIYMLSRADPAHPDLPFAIYRDEGDIPRDKLLLHYGLLEAGGFHAT
jgi:hypothetical protein